MKKFLNIVVALTAVVIMSSCMGDHNQAPSEGVNLDSERVYGVRGGEPKQLKNEYPEVTDETSEKIENIREKLFPKPAKGEKTEEVVEVDSAANTPAE